MVGLHLGDGGMPRGKFFFLALGAKSPWFYYLPASSFPDLLRYIALTSKLSLGLHCKGYVGRMRFSTWKLSLLSPLALGSFSVVIKFQDKAPSH
jgi:hypothetical protein